MNVQHSIFANRQRTEEDPLPLGMQQGDACSSRRGQASDLWLLASAYCSCTDFKRIMYRAIA
jgi:hypothetical protein